MLFTNMENVYVVFISVSAKSKQLEQQACKFTFACVFKFSAYNALGFTLFPECSRILKFWVQSLKKLTAPAHICT